MTVAGECYFRRKNRLIFCSRVGVGFRVFGHDFLRGFGYFFCATSLQALGNLEIDEQFFHGHSIDAFKGAAGIVEINNKRIGQLYGGLGAHVVVCFHGFSMPADGPTTRCDYRATINSSQEVVNLCERFPTSGFQRCDRRLLPIRMVPRPWCRFT